MYYVTYIIEADDDQEAQDQADEAYAAFDRIVEGPIVEGRA